MNANLTALTETAGRWCRTWLAPAFSCLTSLALAGTGVTLTLGCLALSLFGSGINLAAVAGVFGGVLLTVCGGFSLIWSLARCQAPAR